MKQANTQQALFSLPEPRLEILLQGKPSGAETPFRARLLNEGIELAVPIVAKVSVRDGFRWLDLHNGQRWGEFGFGLSSSSDTITFQVPNSSEVRVQTQGKQWVVRLKASLPAARPVQWGDLTRASRTLGLSVAGHLVLILTLWMAASNPFQWGALENAVGPQAISPAKKEEASKPSAAGGGQASITKPFQGMTYTEYHRRVERAKLEADPLGYLAQSLNKMKVKSGSANALGGGVQSATGAIGSGLGKGQGSGTAMTDLVSNQKFNLQASGEGGITKISDKQKMALREKFRDLQDEFKRIYSKLLSQDPNLTVTVSFQTKIQPSGYLELSDFKARGTYQPQTLPALKNAMAEVIRGVFVGPELSGLTLRGENVFVR